MPLFSTRFKNAEQCRRDESYKDEENGNGAAPGIKLPHVLDASHVWLYFQLFHVLGVEWPQSLAITYSGGIRCHENDCVDLIVGDGASMISKHVDSLVRE